jgi:hypothetical protein
MTNWGSKGTLNVTPAHIFQDLLEVVDWGFSKRQVSHLRGLELLEDGTTPRHFERGGIRDPGKQQQPSQVFRRFWVRLRVLKYSNKCDMAFHRSHQARRPGS